MYKAIPSQASVWLRVASVVITPHQLIKVMKLKKSSGKGGSLMSRRIDKRKAMNFVQFIRLRM